MADQAIVDEFLKLFRDQSLQQQFAANQGTYVGENFPPGSTPQQLAEGAQDALQQAGVDQGAYAGYGGGSPTFTGGEAGLVQQVAYFTSVYNNTTVDDRDVAVNNQITALGNVEVDNTVASGDGAIAFGENADLDDVGIATGANSTAAGDVEGSVAGAGGTAIGGAAPPAGNPPAAGVDGWTYTNLEPASAPGGTPPPGSFAERYQTTQAEADGRFGVGFDPINTGNAPAGGADPLFPVNAPAGEQAPGAGGTTVEGSQIQSANAGGNVNQQQQDTDIKFGEKPPGTGAGPPEGPTDNILWGDYHYVPGSPGGATAPAQGPTAIQPIEEVPAATVLLPHFEVDLDKQQQPQQGTTVEGSQIQSANAGGNVSQQQTDIEFGQTTGAPDAPGGAPDAPGGAPGAPGGAPTGFESRYLPGGAEPPDGNAVGGVLANPPASALPLDPPEEEPPPNDAFTESIEMGSNTQFNQVDIANDDI